MDPLPDRCEPCASGAGALAREDAQARMDQVPGWELDWPRLRRRFELKDFRAALAWINRVGMLAEEQGHHPDFHLTSWNRVELVLWTHTADGLTLNDFVMATQIDALARKDGL